MGEDLSGISEVDSETNEPNRNSAAQHARQNIVLTREVAQFIQIALYFLHLFLKNLHAFLRRAANAWFVQRNSRLRDAIVGPRHGR